ncbi:unnamed protein product [Notodromas monacha]|uniref:KxDL domain-containing protein n=1 Tax=Notodromas monacha TaxID=399045 RepID=A0A7R9BHH6_9CRUS|nr:unnamed protein product [Notodromas monacha]CAG0915585.1 unnamed protein product [Notodromas monacha]
MESPVNDSEDGEESLAVDCFQNYSPSEVFVQSLARQTDEGDVETILCHQRDLLSRYEKTNEMLVNSTTVSAMRSQNAAVDFKRHVTVLREMKKDLDYVFRKVRVLKSRIKDRNPEAFAVAERSVNSGRLRSDSSTVDEADEVEGKT